MLIIMSNWGNKMRHVYIPIKMANIKKLRIPRTDKQAEHKELSYTAVRMENGIYSHSGKQLGSSLASKTYIHLPHESAIPLLGFLPK